VRNLAAPHSVDARRFSMGLRPLDDYLSRFEADRYLRSPGLDAVRPFDCRSSAPPPLEER
jgi:hypothetical protein